MRLQPVGRIINYVLNIIVNIDSELDLILSHIRAFRLPNKVVNSELPKYIYTLSVFTEVFFLM